MWNYRDFLVGHCGKCAIQDAVVILLDGDMHHGVPPDAAEKKKKPRKCRLKRTESLHLHATQMCTFLKISDRQRSPMSADLPHFRKTRNDYAPS